jgi:hypothetical protein
MLNDVLIFFTFVDQNDVVLVKITSKRIISIKWNDVVLAFKVNLGLKISYFNFNP